MQFHEREYLVNRIIAGFTICSFNEDRVLVYEPSAYDKLIAQEIYNREYENAILEGVPTEEEMLKQLQIRGMWSKILQDELDKLPQSIEDLKVELYNAYFQFKRRDGIKKSLDNLRLKEVKLIEQKDRFKHVTCEGFALACKNKHLICSGTKYPDGTKFFKSSYDNYSQIYLDYFVQEYYAQKLDDNTIRELSRGEPWRSLWSAGKTEGNIFGIPASQLSAEQKLICIWSKMYDSIMESSECPPEEVLNDNDCLDGWMTVQSRNRESERKSEHGYKPGDKFNKADEVFIMVENPEDAARVNAMNSPAAILRKQQRMSALDKAGGKIEEQHMPDSQNRMREQIMGMLNNKNNRRG